MLQYRLAGWGFYGIGPKLGALKEKEENDQSMETEKERVWSQE